ncbi:hypothetical protein [Parasitella parasitica]|uniref:Tyrosine-protein phosphatase domain-containing protein n=1 Tax=Parasitella parasitica TaxID=35722 RepID=A0A0B7NAE4_9FUNG|nr:hypothetical protein [Parasitella parasitica]
MGANNLNLLSPPEQFGIVGPGIYRSDMLQQPHFSYLKQFGFKTLVMLSPELPNRVTTNFIEEGDIKLVHVGMATWKPTQPTTWRPVSEELIKEGLELILDYRSYAGTKARYVNEQFIELFDLDLVTLPLHLPAWFIDQQRMLAEEEAEEASRLQ